MQFEQSKQAQNVYGYSLTHWGRDKVAANFQTTFSNAFSPMKMFEFRLIFHWILFLRVQFIIISHWFRWWLGAEQATSHYLNQWWPNLLTHICVSRPQWVNYTVCLNGGSVSSWERGMLLPLAMLLVFLVGGICEWVCWAMRQCRIIPSLWHI